MVQLVDWLVAHDNIVVGMLGPLICHLLHLITAQFPWIFIYLLTMPILSVNSARTHTHTHIHTQKHFYQAQWNDELKILNTIENYLKTYIP